MSDTAQRVLRFLDARAAEQIEFVRALCEQNSHTPNKAGTDRVAAMVLQRLEGILPHREATAQVETGDHHVLRNAPGAPKAIYLVGHLDTVFPIDHPFQKCRIDGDVMVGPGCGDMKGGVAVIVYALLALKEANALGRLPLTVMLNGDEEMGSVYSRPLFLAETGRAEICLVAECAGKAGEIVVSRNGKMGARVECFGQDRHVGFGTHEKSSAVLEMAHKVIALEALNASLPGVSLNAGKVEGGLGATTVAARAACWLDIRWEQEAHREGLLAAIDRLLETPVQPGCRSELHILNSRPAMPLRAATEHLFAVLRRVGEELGQEIRPEHRRGTSDVNFFGAAGVPALDGFGPISEHDHTPHEYIRLSSLRQRSALLAMLLVEYGALMEHTQ